MTPPGWRGFRLTQGLALGLLLVGVLPIVNWIPGGHEAPWYGERLSAWGSSSVLVAGVGVLGVWLCARVPTLWRDGAWQRLGHRWQRSGWAGDLLLAGLVAASCALIALVVFERQALLIDEVIQRYQARIFASGRTWLPAPAVPMFTSAMHLLDWDGRVYGQFPAGGPALLALGTLLHAEWLVGPVASGVSILAFARLLRRIEPEAGAALAALLLCSVAPFLLFMGGSYMNHVTTLTMLLLAAWGLVVATGPEARPGAAFWTGLALGVAATIRPMDGVVFALPTAVWLAWRVRRGRPHFRALLVSGVGVALPLAALLAVNASQTGDPLRFGYIEMWGATHRLGFHDAPWGFAHTPWRGLELVNLYLLRMQTWLLETPVPALVPVSLALWYTRYLTAFDRWVLTASGGLLLAYFAYWHDGFYLGPRFLFPMAPWLVLWIARAPGRMATAGVPRMWRQGVLIAGVTALVGGLGINAPIRGMQYHNSLQAMRVDPDALTASHGVRGAVVLVRESWGGQLMTRLWGLGVARPRAEQLYRSVDACVLETAVAQVEWAGGGAAALEHSLTAALADTAGLSHLLLVRDTTLRVRPGATYSPRCIRRMEEHQTGFALYPPMLLASGANQYLLDLHDLNTLILDSTDTREVWLLSRPPAAGATATLHRVAMDSAWAVWRRERADLAARVSGSPR